MSVVTSRCVRDPSCGTGFVTVQVCGGAARQKDKAYRKPPSTAIRMPIAMSLDFIVCRSSSRTDRRGRSVALELKTDAARPRSVQ